MHEATQSAYPYATRVSRAGVATLADALELRFEPAHRTYALGSVFAQDEIALVPSRLFATLGANTARRLQRRRAAAERACPVALHVSDAGRPATQAGALESIERNARVQARLIEDLLEGSRIVTGSFACGCARWTWPQSSTRQWRS